MSNALARDGGCRHFSIEPHWLGFPIHVAQFGTTILPTPVISYRYSQSPEFRLQNCCCKLTDRYSVNNCGCCCCRLTAVCVLNVSFCLTFFEFLNFCSVSFSMSVTMKNCKGSIRRVRVATGCISRRWTTWQWRMAGRTFRTTHVT